MATTSLSREEQINQKAILKYLSSSKLPKTDPNRGPGMAIAILSLTDCVTRFGDDETRQVAQEAARNFIKEFGASSPLATPTIVKMSNMGLMTIPNEEEQKRQEEHKRQEEQKRQEEEARQKELVYQKELARRRDAKVKIREALDLLASTSIKIEDVVFEVLREKFEQTRLRALSRTEMVGSKVTMLPQMTALPRRSKEVQDNSAI